MPTPSCREINRTPDRGRICRCAVSSFAGVGLVPMLAFSSFRAGGVFEIAGDSEVETIARGLGPWFPSARYSEVAVCHAIATRQKADCTYGGCMLKT
jgi:hypothetical protein